MTDKTLPPIPTHGPSLQLDDYNEGRTSGLSQLFEQGYEVVGDPQSVAGIQVVDKTDFVKDLSEGSRKAHAENLDMGWNVFVTYSRDAEDFLTHKDRVFNPDDHRWYGIQRDADGQPKWLEWDAGHSVLRVQTTGSEESLIAPRDYYKFGVDTKGTEYIEFRGVGGIVEKFTVEILGTAAFDALMAFVKTSPKNERSYVENLGVYAAKESVYHTLKKTVQDSADGAAITIDLKNGIHFLNGDLILADIPNLTPCLVTMIRAGFLRDATQIDMQNATVTFADKNAALDALKQIFLIGRDTYVMDKSFGEIGGSQAHEHGLAFYLHGADTEEFTDDLYTTTAWHHGAYAALTEGLEGYEGVHEDNRVSDDTVYSTLKVAKDITGKNGAEDIRLGDFSQELALMRERRADFDQYRYYTFVVPEDQKDDVTAARLTMLTLPAEDEGREVLYSYSDLKNLDLGDLAPASLEQIQYQLYSVRTLNNIVGADISAEFRVLNTEDYLFTTPSNKGDILLVRVPLRNIFALTGGIQMNSAHETGSPTTGLPGEETAMYMTFDVSEQFNSVLEAFTAGAGGSRSGDRVKMMLDPNAPEQKFYNPRKSHVETALAYRYSFDLAFVQQMIIPTIRELRASGYPFDFEEGEQDEGKIIRAAFATFSDGNFLQEILERIDFPDWVFHDGMDDWTFWMPGEDDLFVNDYTSFQDEQAWDDPLPNTLFHPHRQRSAKVHFGQLEMDRREAAYYVMQFLTFSENASVFGMTPLDLRKHQETVTRNSVLGSTVLLGLPMLLVMIWTVRRQEKLTGGTGELGLDNVNDTSKVLRNISGKVAQDDNDSGTIGRDDLAKEVLVKLARNDGPNSALIYGEAGVGKTQFVELVAEIINTEDKGRGFLESLRDAQIYELNLNGLKAGTAYRGQYEKKLMNLLEEVAKLKGKNLEEHWAMKSDTFRRLFERYLAIRNKILIRGLERPLRWFERTLILKGLRSAPDFEDGLIRVAIHEVCEKAIEKIQQAQREGRRIKIILFIDEIHATMLGHDGAELGSDPWQELKKYLSTGEIQIIGATTDNPRELERVKRDEALMRRFGSPIYFGELDKGIINEITQREAEKVWEQQLRYDPFASVLPEPTIDGALLYRVWRDAPTLSTTGGRPSSTNDSMAAYVIQRIQDWSIATAELQKQFREAYDAAPTDEAKAQMIEQFRAALSDDLKSIELSAEDYGNFIASKNSPTIATKVGETKYAVDRLTRELNIPIDWDFATFAQIDYGEQTVEERITRYSRVHLVVTNAAQMFYSRHHVMPLENVEAAREILGRIMQTAQVNSQDLESLIRIFPELNNVTDEQGFPAIRSLLELLRPQDDSDDGSAPAPASPDPAAAPAAPADGVDDIDLDDGDDDSDAAPAATVASPDASASAPAPATTPVPDAAPTIYAPGFGSITTPQTAGYYRLNRNGDAPTDGANDYDLAADALSTEVRLFYENLHAADDDVVAPATRKWVLRYIHQIYATRRGEDQTTRARRMDDAERAIDIYKSNIGVARQDAQIQQALRTLIRDLAAFARTAELLPLVHDPLSEEIDRKLRGKKGLFATYGLKYDEFKTDLEAVYKKSTSEDDTAYGQRLEIFKGEIDILVSNLKAMPRILPRNSFQIMAPLGMTKRIYESLLAKPQGEQYIQTSPRLKAYDDLQKGGALPDDTLRAHAQDINRGLLRQLTEYQGLRTQDTADPSEIETKQIEILQYVDNNKDTSRLCGFLFRVNADIRLQVSRQFPTANIRMIYRLQFEILHETLMQITEAKRTSTPMGEVATQAKSRYQDILRQAIQSQPQQFGFSDASDDGITSFVSSLADSFEATFGAYNTSSRTRSR